ALALGAVQKGQFALEPGQDNLGGVFLDAVLVSPFSGLQLAFDIDLRAFPKVLVGNLGEVLVEDHHPVPFGALPTLAGLAVTPCLRGGNAQIDDHAAVLSMARFRATA